jgi:hypothetical protein
MFSLSLTCHSVLGLLERFKGTLNKHSETARHRAEMGLEAGNILDHLLQSFIKFKAYLHTMFNDVDINLPYFAKFHLVTSFALSSCRLKH